MASFAWGDGAGAVDDRRRAARDAASGRRPSGADDRDAARRAGLRRAVARLSARATEATGFGVFAYSRAGYGASDPGRCPARSTI